MGTVEIIVWLAPLMVETVCIAFAFSRIREKVVTVVFLVMVIVWVVSIWKFVDGVSGG